MVNIKQVQRTDIFVGIIVAVGLIDFISKVLLMARVNLFVPASWSNTLLSITVGVVFCLV